MHRMLFRYVWLQTIHTMKNFAVLILVMMFTSCDVAEDIVRSKANPTQADQGHLRRLQEDYGRQFDFAFEDIYLRARSRAGLATKEDAIKLCQAFWFDATGEPRRDSNLVYLNIYDQRGDFQFQVYWDRAQRSLAFSRTEHY